MLKERKDPKDVRSYRAVALKNILCKIFEKKIIDRQFGFRKQRSTIDTISKTTTKILNDFRRKEKTAAIFFNIEKAFEIFIRDKTLEQLENMGIQGEC